MAVVVRQSFKYKGRDLKRGEVLLGADAEELQGKRQFRRFITTAPDKHFAHLQEGAVPAATAAPAEQAQAPAAPVATPPAAPASAASSAAAASASTK